MGKHFSLFTSEPNVESDKNKKSVIGTHRPRPHFITFGYYWYARQGVCDKGESCVKIIFFTKHTGLVYDMSTSAKYTWFENLY